MVLNIIHAKLSLLSNVVASGSMILDHYQRFGGDGERFSAVNVVVLMNIYIPDW